MRNLLRGIMSECFGDRSHDHPLQYQGRDDVAGEQGANARVHSLHLALLGRICIVSRG